MQTYAGIRHLFMYLTAEKMIRRPLESGRQGSGIFAIFSCLPSVKENRVQPADPAYWSFLIPQMMQIKHHS